MSKRTKQTTPGQLRSLKKRTGWSWEKMCREMCRVMECDGPSHTTLFRYANGNVTRRNVLTDRFVREAIGKLAKESFR